MWDNGYAVLDFYFYFGVTIYLCSIVKQIVEVWGNIRNFVKKIILKEMLDYHSVEISWN